MVSHAIWITYTREFSKDLKSQSFKLIGTNSKLHSKPYTITYTSIINMKNLPASPSPRLYPDQKRHWGHQRLSRWRQRRLQAGSIEDCCIFVRKRDVALFNSWHASFETDNLMGINVSHIDMVITDRRLRETTKFEIVPVKYLLIKVSLFPARLTLS